MMMSTSPALAGLAVDTGEKSEKWKKTGPLAVVTICRTDIGIRCKRLVNFAPSLMRRP
jgi:hypothetical protein